LLIVPVATALALQAPRRLMVLAAATIAVAEVGRRRGDGGSRRVFPATSALWAPLWLVERGLCSWAAVWLRLRGGVRYSDGRLARAGTSLKALTAEHRIARKTSA
jgi:hypothetical protein